ncbi:MAG: hypothetical protein WCC60_16405 [Ilumatobacteraceae bacterium]
MSALLAHQGGWDEILLVLGPILVIAGLLQLAKKRVERSAIQSRQHDEQHNLSRQQSPFDERQP